MKKKKQKPQQQRRTSQTSHSNQQPFVLNPNQKLPTIGLSIIVKNESRVIERMLNTVWPILDYYHVVDTGSTDGTQDIIRNFFKEKGIPGEVIDHPWKNFEDARNTALNGLKEKADFGFWIDADEQLIVNPNFNKDMFKMSLLGFDGANVKVSYGSQNYFRMQFFATKTPWRWYGPVHEVLVCDQEHKAGIAEGLITLVTPDGNSWTAETIQQKYEGHAKILEDYVANDPTKDPRWVFYLAQSYRDAGTPENQKKSIEWYEKRSTMMNGFWEEIYYSLLMVASLKGALQYPIHEIIDAYLKCGKSNIYRAEHLIPVILHYQSVREFDISYMFSSHAMKYAGKSPFPQSSLFIDPTVYDWRIYDMHALNCYYSGRKDEGIQTFKSLLKAIDKGLVPADQVQRIQNNKQWFI
jgi:glycosyltransferase involved in cell wall biosynthesis